MLFSDQVFKKEIEIRKGTGTTHLMSIVRVYNIRYHFPYEYLVLIGSASPAQGLPSKKQETASGDRTQLCAADGCVSVHRVGTTDIRVSVQIRAHAGRYQRASERFEIARV